MSSASLMEPVNSVAKGLALPFSFGISETPVRLRTWKNYKDLLPMTIIGVIVTSFFEVLLLTIDGTNTVCIPFSSSRREFRISTVDHHRCRRYNLAEDAATLTGAGSFPVCHLQKVFNVCMTRQTLVLVSRH